MYTLKGELKVINDTRQVSEKFKLREFVLTTEGDYPQVIQFQSVQDKTELLDVLTVGQQVEVFFNLRGREWTNADGVVKVFNTLDAWKINLLSSPNTTSNDPAF
jgi:hypothetical protein